MLSVVLAACLCSQIPYEIEGDVVQVVRKAPFTVKIAQEGELFFWTVPDGWDYEEQGPDLLVKSAPVGEASVRVRVVTIDWDARKMIQASGEVKLVIGGLPAPPGPNPTPDKPDVPGDCGGKTGRAKEVCGWLKTVPEKSRGPQAKLSAMFAELGEGLDRGRWINYSESNAWFREQQQAILTPDVRDDWAVFGSRVSQALAPLAQSPRSEVIQFYRDVSEGLK